MYIGRAGTKLEHALSSFKVDVKDKVCADFGSAVGGFVDCLLQHGAKKVYAVETGYGILDWKLRSDPRVITLEKTNAMHVSLPEKVDLVTIDASWTKQKNIIPNAKSQLKTNGLIITLIKPHYESGQPKLSPQEAEVIATQTLDYIHTLGVSIIAFTKSPLTGTKGENTEYLALLKV